MAGPYGAPQPLGDNPCVRHTHDDGQIEARFYDGQVVIVVMNGEQLVIEPIVANSVRIRIAAAGS